MGAQAAAGQREHFLLELNTQFHLNLLFFTQNHEFEK